MFGFVARIAERFPFLLVARSDTEFFARTDGRRIVFDRAPDGRAQALFFDTAKGPVRAPRDGP